SHAARRPERAAVRPRTRQAHRQPLRVMVVDDNRDAAELLGEALRCAGHEIAVAHDGPEALSALESFDAEVALIDIGLPVMDGYELAGRMRLRSPTLQLIALTGYGQEHDQVRSREAGCMAHFVKPANLDDLLQTIERAQAALGQSERVDDKARSTWLQSP